MLLTACTPDYNWRELREPAAGFNVMLPGKPASMSRPIDLDGLPVTMTMTGARVDDIAFTVGAVHLPDALPATREKAVAAMRTAMARNIAGRETAQAEVDVTVLDSGGRSVARHPALRVQISGSTREQPAQMAAEFVARGDRAWQVVVVGPALPAEQAQLFLDSFRIVE
ncbi:MAG: hypothetical protein AB7L76_00585 [Burkholderiaceae bacterium]